MTDRSDRPRIMGVKTYWAVSDAISAEETVRYAGAEYRRSGVPCVVVTRDGLIRFGVADPAEDGPHGDAR